MDPLPTLNRIFALVLHMRGRSEVLLIKDLMILQFFMLEKEILTQLTEQLVLLKVQSDFLILDQTGDLHVLFVAFMVTRSTNATRNMVIHLDIKITTRVIMVQSIKLRVVFHCMMLRSLLQVFILMQKENNLVQKFFLITRQLQCSLLSNINNF